jgi:hypothetical protein
MYLFVSLVVVITTNASAQISINSPYSRYAIGQIYKKTDPLFMAMGGMSIAYRSPYIINYSNPASYAAFDTLSFVFQGGLNSDFVTLKDEFSSSKSNYTSLSYLLFGFPLTRWWRTSIGILPYSTVGYDIRANEIDENIGNIEYIYDGSGGVNRFYWGNGFKINKNFAIGFNLSYLFGDIEKTRAVNFPDSIYRYSFLIKNSTVVNDIIFDYGLQYSKKFKNNLTLEAGLVFCNSLKVKTKETQYAATYIETSGGGEYIKDTIESYPENSGNIILPSSFGLGVILKNEDRWLVGIDYYWRNWKKYSSFGESDSLDNSMQISVGTQFTPDNSSVSKYWEKINYRLGFKYARSYVELRDEHLRKFGISFGLGIPLKRTRSTLNFAIELGKTGTTNKELIQENYIQLSFGVSIFERWFFKKKYD